MSDLHVDLDAERTAARERMELDLDEELARRMAERLFYAADDKLAELELRTVNDAIAERALVSSYQEERLRRFISLVDEAYSRTRDAWLRRREASQQQLRDWTEEERPERAAAGVAASSSSSEVEKPASQARPEQETSKVTHEKRTARDWFNVDAQDAEIDEGHDIIRWGPNRLAAYLAGVIRRGWEADVWKGTEEQVFYNHIRPYLLDRGWEPNLTGKQIAERAILEPEPFGEPVPEDPEDTEDTEDTEPDALPEVDVEAEREVNRMAAEIEDAVQAAAPVQAAAQPAHIDYRLRLDGPWGELEITGEGDGTEPSVFLQGRLPAGVADRIAGLVLFTKFSIGDPEE